VNQSVYRDVLPEGYKLHWYEIESVLGRGGSGVTYLANDTNLDQQVAIKEYFPLDFSSRDEEFTVHATEGQHHNMYSWGLDRFIKEARILAKFKHPNIVRIFSVFEQNNTAYIIMEYEQGEDLSTISKQKKQFTVEELLNIYLPILDGLKLVHKAGFIHRDIKPANIYIRQDGSPVLIDFGAARHAVGGETQQQLTSIVTYGYAPFEQYNESDEKQGPWTDMYALGACLYVLVIGELPIEAMARGSAMLSKGFDPYRPASVVAEGKYPAAFLRAIDHALMFYAEERPQDIDTWADMLTGKIEVPTLPKEMLEQPPSNEDDATVVIANRRTWRQPTTTAQPSISTPVSTSKKKIITIGAISLLIAVAIITVIALVPSEPKPVPPQETAETLDEKQQRIATLLVEANNARKQGKILVPLEESAVHFYKLILKIEPIQKEAADSIDEFINRQINTIRDNLADNNLDQADMDAKQLQAALPNSAKVAEILQEVNAAKTGKVEIARLLEQAKEYIATGRLIRPADDNALFYFRQVLELKPDELNAKQGIEGIIRRFELQVYMSLNKGDLARAEQHIEDIKTIDPLLPSLQQLNLKFQAQKKQHDKLLAQKRRQERVTSTLSQANSAFGKKQLIKPPRQNALYLYKQVLKLEPHSKEAQRGIERIESYFESQFTKHLASANFDAAESIVKTVEKTMPSSALAKNMRNKLEKSKLPTRPDSEIIFEMIGNFKATFEARNVAALSKMSEFKSDRLSFIKQFFAQYTAYKLEVSELKHIAKERKGSANITIVDLVNIHGEPVQAGTWSRFNIQIKQNSSGQWRVYW
jgi:serine/threonine protein kinase